MRFLKERIERYKGSWIGCNSVSRKTLRLNGLGAEDYAQVPRGVVVRGMGPVYGLPEQNESGFGQTIAQIITMRRDRVRCYSYAHVPARQPHQFANDQQSLPSSADRLALFHRAVIDFTQSGYTWIGADCFATAEDEWSIAQAGRRLQRTCIGSTAVAADHLVALGTNGIEDVDGVMAHNEPRIDSWRRAILAGRLPFAWGRRLSDEDRRRREAFELLAHPIPTGAQKVLYWLPARAASRVLLAAIRRNAWTVAGSDELRVKAGFPPAIAIASCCICKGARAAAPLCDYYASAFERLFQVLVHAGAQVSETACQAMGADACRFELAW
jgi:bacteriochlorophyll 4-vinyl reductase